MPVTVKFRGICLFIIEDGLLLEVLLPEAEDGKPREQKRGLHVDRTETRKHFAGMLIPGQKHRKLKKASVTIVAEDETSGPDAGRLETLPNLSDLGNDVEDLEIQGDDVAKKTKFTLMGGEITTAQANTDRSFSFLHQDDRHDKVDITFEKTVTITIDGKALPPFDPATNPTVYFFNFDTATPDDDALEIGNQSDDIVIRDDDFKWHFLLVAPSGNDKQRLEKWTVHFDGFLPCPKSGVNFLTVSGSTCYPATFTKD